MPVKQSELILPTLLQDDVGGWRNQGWPGVTQTTAELLHYWFEEERDGKNFHPCQQKGIEPVIYCHEILRIHNPCQLYTEFSAANVKVAQVSRYEVSQDEI